MKKLFIILSIFHFAFSVLNSSAAVPLKWTVETSRLQPAVFDVVRGETLSLEASFQSYGKPLAMTNDPCCIFWQTNGMGNAWWTSTARTSAALSGSISNVVTAAFTPQMDPGGATVNGFIGSTGQIYRAAFTLRFRHGPGSDPNVIDMPPRILDLAHTVVINPPWPTQADFSATTTVMRAELKDFVLDETERKRDIFDFVVYTNDFDLSEFEKRMPYPDGKITQIRSINGSILLNWYPHALEENFYPLFECSVVRPSEGNAEYLYVREFLSSMAAGLFSDLYLKYIPKTKLVQTPDSIAKMSEVVPVSRKINGQTLTNDITIDPGVTSVNGQTGNVTITHPVSSVNLKTGNVTLNAQDVGAYPYESGNVLATQVATQGAHLNAEDAQFVSTNYDSIVNIPEAYVRIKLQQGGTNVWRTIWEEMRRWNKFCGTGFNWQTWGGFHTWSTNLLAMIEETSPKEYAFYDGTTGYVAPDGFFWISQPRIGICAGAGYQRYLDTGGAVWILESNGLVANIGGTTNGYFRISDEEGNTQFEIIKGDKQTVPAISRSVTSTNVMGVTHWYSVYAVTNALAPPVAKFCRNLGANPPVWIADTEASCPCNVTWTPGVNTYTLEFWPKSTEPAMFCKAEYDRGGKTRIRQVVPVEMQTIMIGGTEYSISVTEIDGKKVPKLTEVN